MVVRRPGEADHPLLNTVQSYRRETETASLSSVSELTGQGTLVQATDLETLGTMTRSWLAILVLIFAPVTQGSEARNCI